MKKSFDDIFSEKLSDFEMAPPPELKGSVMSSVQTTGSNFRALWGILVLVFMLFSFYPVGEFKGTDELVLADQMYLDTSNVNKNEEVPDLDQVVQYKDPIKNISEKITESNQLNLDYSVEEENLSVKYYSGDGHYSLEGMNHLNLVNENEILNNPEFQYVFKGNKTDLITKKETLKLFRFYFNTGVFLNYNRVRPNLSDDIYIGDYDSPYALAPSRLGITLESGIHKQWSERIATRLGISFNNFNQGYSFLVRSTQPDDVVLNEESGVFEPLFEEEKVSINKRVSMLGVKGQLLWYAFPNKTSVLFSSFEYQHLMSDGPMFSYDGESYKLMLQSQYLVEIGLRKLIMQRKRGELYLMPSVRYSLTNPSEDQIVSVKPFSAGLTLSYGLK